MAQGYNLLFFFRQLLLQDSCTLSLVAKLLAESVY